MRFCVVGGSGLVGDKVMTALHDAVAASPAFGIDAFTGEGLDEAMAGADVVVDVSDAPAWGDERVLAFFTTVTRNALEAGRRAGARHHVALSVLGADRLPGSGYLRAKVAQEALLRGAGVPLAIVRSAPFMEALARHAHAGAQDGVVRVPDARVQPVAAVEVARLVAAVAARPRVDGVVEIAGPDRLTFAGAVGRMLAASGDARPVVADPGARYLGAAVAGDVLLPGAAARIARVGLEDWLARGRAHPVAGRA